MSGPFRLARTRPGPGLAALLALLIAGAAAAQPISLDAIFREPFKFDRHMITIQGHVGLIERGAARPTFQLIDGIRTIRVVAPPQPAVRVGDRVEVQGLLNAAANQIDAIRVTWR